MRRALLVVIAALLVAPGHASATTDILDAARIDTVAVDGAATVAILGGDGPGGALRLVGPDGVRSTPGPEAFGGAMVGDVQLAAGGGRIALARFDIEVADSPTGTASILTAGPAAGPLDEVTRCTGRNGVSRQATSFPPAAPVIDATTVVWLACGREERRVRIVGPAGATTLRFGGRVWSLALAGRTLAVGWLEPSGRSPARVRLVPLDGGAGRDVRIPGPASGIAVAGQPDGTVVALAGPGETTGCGPATVHVVDPGATVARRLPFAGCGTRVAAGGGFVVTQRTDDRDSEPDLVVAPLDGTRGPAALDRGQALGGSQAFAADDGRVAWINRGCTRDRVLSMAFGEPTADARASCPVHVGGARLRADGRLRLRVRCPLGCRDTDITLSGIAAPPLTVGLRRPGTRTVTTTLPAAARRGLRRAKRPSLLLRVGATPLGSDLSRDGRRRVPVRVARRSG